MFGDRPTVLAVQTRHHPEHQPGSVPQRLVAAESGSDPVDQRAELGPPSVRIYPVSRGHRGDLVVPHKQRILARWPPTPTEHALISENEPNRNLRSEDHELGGSGAGAVANGSAVGLALLPEFPRGQLSLQPWPVSLPFPAPARHTVHAVLPHTAYRRSSPAAFDFPGPKRPGRDDDPIKADQTQVVERRARRCCGAPRPTPATGHLCDRPCPATHETVAPDRPWPTGKACAARLEPDPTRTPKRRN